MRFFAALLLAFILLAPLNVYAAGAYLGGGAGGFTGGGSNSHSASITIPSGTDLLIILGFHEGLNINSPTAPTAATVAGVSATAVAQTPSGEQNSGWVKMFYYLSPPSGSQTVAVSGASGAGGGNGTGYQWVAYSGFAQSGQPDSSGKTNYPGSATASLTLTTTVVASNCWLIAGWAHQNTTGISYTGLTQRVDTIPENAYGIADSNGIVGTGSQSGTINFSPNQTNNGIIASFCEAASAATFNPAYFYDY